MKVIYQGVCKDGAPSGGFTLIELLLSIGIVALLSAIALFSYAKFVEKSKVTAALNAVWGLRDACVLYYTVRGNFEGLSIDNDRDLLRKEMNTVIPSQFIEKFEVKGLDRDTVKIRVVLTGISDTVNGKDIILTGYFGASDPRWSREGTLDRFYFNPF
jgi:prepilin-type N-terminal cleavage/methylation domain-containing protein